MSIPSSSESAAFQPHDHHDCRDRALAEAAAACRERRLNLTPVRAFVLEALLEEHRALTAYELLDRLRAAGHGSQPPVVYRALEFLVTNGFVHRIERLSAYVACTHGVGEHSAAFMVCRLCRTVAETAQQAERGLSAQAERTGFVVERLVVEAEGVCARCRDGGA